MNASASRIARTLFLAALARHRAYERDTNPPRL